MLSRISEFIKQQIDLYGDEFALSSEQVKSISDDPDPKEDVLVQEANSLQELYDGIHTCTECPLGTKRTRFVFGEGNPDADIMLIGEAPGADEDRTGHVFAGEAGELLNKILAAIDLSREEVFIGNILKCRPPLNRDPLPEEIDTCLPYLYQQIELINPAFILCLGRVAAHTLLQTNEALSKLRLREHNVGSRRCMVTYHPAALLRNTELKCPTWEDVKLLKQRYEEWKVS
ncbi:MAG: uracil-DNA glycosylase [candidate division KSB1 bacterium]|nr:uracil-DNA glycosylase [candidate division KSB1 bacterium]